MGLDGGGGGGGGGGGILGVTGSFTGPAEALELIGDHAMAYSGVLDIAAETDMLNFTTGNFYFVGTVQFNYIELNAYHFRYRFYLNDAVVEGFVEPSGSSGAPNVATTIIPIIIPAYTVVRCTAENLTDGSTPQEQVCSMIGRIYRG